MNRHPIRSGGRHISLNHAFGLAALLAAVKLADAQVLVTSIPANGATGVSPSSPVIFMFSGPVDTNVTAAAFYSLSPPGAYPVSSVWNSTSNMLTCTPSPAFPSGRTISWVVNGQDAGGTPVTAMGSLTTGPGSGNTGSGTNAITTFLVGKVVSYDQYSNAPPLLDPNVPYLFSGTTTLASNRSATSITLTLPTGSVSNLIDNFTQPENWNLTYFTTNSATFDATVPQGNYTFFVSATASNQTVVDPLPASMSQPPAPHVTNYTAAQSVTASQPFTVYWDAFAGAVTADFVYLVVGNVWQTPPPGAPGAMNGLTTSFTIPAGSLQPNTNYLAFLGFYHATWTSNATFAVGAYRGSVTRFNLSTSSSASAPVLVNAAWAGGTFGVDIDTSPGQMVTVIASSNCALPLAQWQALLVTNSPGSRFHFSAPAPITNKTFFYGARNGP